MQAFASLRSEWNATVPARREMLEAHRATVLAQVRALQQSETVLQAKIAHYRQIEQTLSKDPPLVEGTHHDPKSL